MSLYNYHQELEALSLGKSTKYHDSYQPELLQVVPRRLNREPLKLYFDSLPFNGADIWTLYELSWLNSKGLPQVSVGEVTIDANSVNLIESKSFKLYLNSFNQTKFADWEEVSQTIEHDLSACVVGNVSVTLFRLQEIEGHPIGYLDGTCIDEQDIEIDNYCFNADYLQEATGKEILEERLISHLLKSNCPITNQPDWGSLQISYRGPRIQHEALLRYIVSFRHHNEFHEQCIERIFNDIIRLCRTETLSVYARYTRRGGLDINPWRSTNATFKPSRSRLVRQ